MSPLLSKYEYQFFREFSKESFIHLSGGIFLESSCTRIRLRRGWIYFKNNFVMVQPINFSFLFILFFIVYFGLIFFVSIPLIQQNLKSMIEDRNPWNQYVEYSQLI